MNVTARARGALVALVLVGPGAVHAAELNLLCSVPSEWCGALAAAFENVSGIKVAVTQKAAAEVLDHLAAQRNVPRYDVWYAGAGDLHMQATELGLTDEYRSPRLPELRAWSVRYAEQAKHRSIALYQRPIGLIVNTRLLAAKQLAEPRCWVDLAKPEYDDQVEMGRPSQSTATRATILALVQVLGEVKAFETLKRIHTNVAVYARRATNAARAVARGDVTLGVVFLWEGANEVTGNFPVKLIAPCEGLAYDVVGMSVFKGARNSDSARKFYDWALTPASLDLQYSFAYWQMPAHQASALPPQVWNTDQAKMIEYDLARFGSAERKRLMDLWERNVGILPR